MSLDSEKQILGSVLINPKIMSSVDLNEDHFSTVPHQHIFAAMRMMSGQQFDVVQLADFMSEHHVGTNWLAILGEMQKDVFSAANYKAHEVIVRKDAAKRFAMLAAQEILDADGSAEVVDSVVSRLLRQEQPQARSIVTLNEAVSEAFTAMEMAQGSQGVTGVPTGLAALDEKIDGYHAGELYIVAGRPGMGKTAFLLRNALSSGVPTLIFSCEQPSLQLGMRSLSLTARVNHHRMRIGKMEEHDWAALVAASGDLHDQRVFIDDRADQTIEGIRQSARYMYHKHDIKIILIDYIQLLTTRQKTQTRDQEITIISRNLAFMAKELSIPVVVLSQLNRNVEQRENKRPRLSDLRESGAIEQDGYVIMFLYRDEYYNEESLDKGVAEIIVGKNKSGPTGVIKVGFKQQFMEFTDSVQWVQ